MNSVSLEGPIKKIAARPIMASSAGPRPKKEWSWVDFDRMDDVEGFGVMDGWCRDDGHDVIVDVGLVVMDRDGEN